MSGITDVNELLGSMQSALVDESFVFCTVKGQLADYIALDPIAMFRESEGLTLVLSQTAADKAVFDYESVFRQITLTVHSSLEAVGLTAAVSTALAAKNISANVIAAYYHDHVFVPCAQAEQALLALEALSHK
ncbi:ACT domain-containing protein [Psychrobacter sp. T6-5]|uniref:ACT domain-containing protein n=1 Tax=Psychrobacter sp. T6-5 TaxID=3457451 RepID=UPI003FD322CB